MKGIGTNRMKGRCGGIQLHTGMNWVWKGTIGTITRWGCYGLRMGNSAWLYSFCPEFTCPFCCSFILGLQESWGTYEWLTTLQSLAGTNQMLCCF